MFMALRKIIIALALIPMFCMAQHNEKILSFPLSDVMLLDSPFKEAQMTDMKYMLEMDMDRLLAPFLFEAGLPLKAEAYGEWESTGLNGHIGGHYLSALAMMYASTGDLRMKKRLDYMIIELKRAQDKHGDGYLAGVPNGRKTWQEIAEGTIKTQPMNLNGQWVPFYNMHKTYAGLRDAYLFAENNDAKEMLVKLTDWAYNLVEGLSDYQLQKMLKTEHGGLNEIFADVAMLTDNKKYLKLAKRFSHRQILDNLILEQDSLTGMHSNTQIPKIIGFKKIATMEQNSSWATGAAFFWNNMTKKRSVAFGGNSVYEHLNPINDFSKMLTADQGPETCNTYNMLKLTKELFLTNPERKYIDYYERALYNHILSSQNPEKGGFVYFTPIRPGHYRVYSKPHTSFWCCVGSGLENHTKYGEMIYAHSKNDLYVNLFIPSKLKWKEREIELVQQTGFPDAENTTLTINTKKEQSFALLLRHPSWVKKGALKVLVNGKKIKTTSISKGYIKISRVWENGDEIAIQLPMRTTVEQLPDGKDYYAFMHGPILLAAKTDTTKMKGLFAEGGHLAQVASDEKFPIDDMPAIESLPKKLVQKVKLLPGKSLTFSVKNLSGNKYNNLKLIPFFRLHESRYIMYWKVKNPE